MVMLLLWNFVFRVCLRLEPPEGEVTRNYTLFLAAGYLPWLLFQESVLRSSNCIVENANLVTKTVFPSEIVPARDLSFLTPQPSARAWPCPRI